MNQTKIKKLITKIVRPVAVIALVMAAGFYLYSHLPVAEARTTNWLPEATDMGAAGSDVHLLVAKRGNGNALDAPVTWAKIYFFNRNNGSIRIHHADFCQGSGIDTNTPAPTNYKFYRADANEHPSLPLVHEANAGVFGPGSSCGYWQIGFSNLTASRVPGHDGWYTAYVRAEHTGPNNGGGINGFKIQVLNNGRAGYWDQGIDAFHSFGSTGGPRPGALSGTREFAIQDRVAGGARDTNMTFEFATRCDAPIADGTSRTAFLRWYDADRGVGNQPGDIRFDLEELDENGNFIRFLKRDFRALGGNDQYGETSFPSRKDRKYRWRWENVSKPNGIQFWVPFDTGNFEQSCRREGQITVEKVNVANGRRIGEGIITSIDGVQGNTTVSAYTRTVQVPGDYRARAERERDEWIMTEVCVSGQRCYSARSSVSVNMPNQNNSRRTVTWKYRQRDWNLDVSLVPIGPWANPGSTFYGVEPGPRYQMQAIVTNNGEWRSSSVTLRVEADPESVLQNKNPSTWSWNLGSINNGESKSRDMSFRINESRATNGQQLCFRAFASPERRSGGTAQSSRLCTIIKLPRYPFVTTVGGDVHAGASFDSEPCLLATDSSKRIIGQISGTRGSKADFIASAGGGIFDFGSAGRADRNNLTFGNTGNRGFYGVTCRPDVFRELYQSQDSVMANSAAEVRGYLTRANRENLIVNYRGNLTINGPITIQRGRHVTLVVDGNVFIDSGSSNGIILHGGPYAERGRAPAINEAPSFALVTSGNIRVDNIVRRLEGIYSAGTAEPTDVISNPATHGIIDTCGNNATGSGPAITSPTNAANRCNNPLTVNGALLARDFRFRRTPGDVRVASEASPAELIKFLPQLYLQPPPGFNSLVSLILNGGERPPIF